jgi:K+-sensing histidine kinase KdpD
MTFTNGSYDGRFNRIEDQLGDIKDNLAMAVAGLTEAIKETSHQSKESHQDVQEVVRELAAAVQALNQHFTIYINIAQNAIPIKAVMWMFLILVLTMAGIEGLKLIPKFWGILP